MITSDVAYVILYVLCGHSVENPQETPGNFPGWATDRQHNAIMGLSGRHIRLGKCLEVRTIVGEQGFVLTDRICQLLGIAVPKLPRFLGRGRDEPAGTNQLGNHTSTSSSRYSSMNRRLIRP